MSLIVTNTAGSLGDWLSITPLLNAVPGTTVVAKDSAHTREFATLYQGLAKVEFTNNDIQPIREAGTGSVSKRILNAYDITGYSPIPIVKLTDGEIAWAKSFLSAYKNPIAFNNTVAGASKEKSSTDICNYRRLPDQLSLDIIRTLKEDGYTIIRFGCKNTQKSIYNNYDEFDGVINIPDLNLRQLAACYHVIGKYVGSATGDIHLMLAVGGLADVFVPPSAWHYDHALHHYRPEDFLGETVRIGYTMFKVNL